MGALVVVFFLCTSSIALHRQYLAARTRVSYLLF